MKKGFTLIELLAVIVILAIILVIAVPKVVNVIKTVKQSTLDSDAALIAKQLELYKESEGLDVTTIEQTDLDTYGFKEDKYDGFKAEVINNKVVVTVIKDDLTGSNYAGTKIYGVRFENSSTGTRTDSAYGLTYSDPAASNVITSSFDTEEIYSEMVEETDSYGNVFIRIPKFYIKKQKLAAKTWTYQISKTKVDSDYYLPACFVDEASNTILPYILVGKYIASVDNASATYPKLESKSGVIPMHSRRIATFRTWAKNNGAGYQLLDIHVLDVLQTLFYIEFATLNSQNIMAGRTSIYDNTYINNGTTDTVVPITGSLTSNTTGTYAMKYRGIENLWGDLAFFLDGINAISGDIYISKDSSIYTSDAFLDVYEKLSYKSAVNNYSYILELGYDPNFPFANITTAFTNSTGSIYKDEYSYTTGTTSRIAIIGGGRNLSTRCGITYMTLTSSTISSNGMSSRLVKMP